MPVSRLVELKIHGAAPEFIGEIRALGFKDEPPHRKIDLKIHGIDGEFIKEAGEYLKKMRKEVTLDNLIRLKIFEYYNSIGPVYHRSESI